MTERGQRANLSIYDDAAIITDEQDAEINEKPTIEEVIKRYSEIHQISIEEAQSQVGADTIDKILKNIQDKTLEKIRSQQLPMNRAQRRALKKKVGAKKYAEMAAGNGDVVEAVSETAKKLNYIDLIQKLRKLNEEKEQEKNGKTTIEDD